MTLAVFQLRSVFFLLGASVFSSSNTTRVFGFICGFGIKERKFDMKKFYHQVKKRFSMGGMFSGGDVTFAGAAT